MARLYIEVGRVVDAVLQESVGLKAALYRHTFTSDARVVCKLAAATLGEEAALRAALKGAGVSGNVDASSEGMLLAMAYDMLIGSGVRGGGRLKRELTAVLPKLKASLKAAQQRLRDKKELDGLPATGAALATLPRYVRINRLRAASDADAANVRSALDKELRRRSRESGDAADDKSLLVADEVVPDLLVAPSHARPWLHGWSAIEDGTLVLQDRSSCLAALSAGISPGSFVLDACSAPGSKTAHALEMLRGSGRLIACERNPKRAGTLIRRLRQLCLIRRGTSTSSRGGKKKNLESEDSWFNSLSESSLKPGSTLRFHASKVPVEVHVGDFLSCNPSEAPFCDVEVLLVDPSCSGSGLPDHHLGCEAEAPVSLARLRRLAAFQRRILSHALRFPSARSVVYSTCSTHREENEDVVEEVLREDPPPPFRAVQALSWWRNAPNAYGGHGGELPGWASHCIRCDPATHRCRGFFLCRLDRLPAGETPEVPPPLTPRQPAVKRKRSPSEADPQQKVAENASKIVNKRRKRRSSKKASVAASSSAPIPVATSKTRKAKTRGLRLGVR